MDDELDKDYKLDEVIELERLCISRGNYFFYYFKK